MLSPDGSLAERVEGADCSCADALASAREAEPERRPSLSLAAERYGFAKLA